MLEAALRLAFLAGACRRITYGAGLLLHTISTASTWKQLIDPFGANHLFIAALPVLAGFIALYLLREQDTMWSLEASRRPRPL